MNILEIKTIEKITPDVLQIRTNKPEGLEFKPGQATELFIKKRKLGKIKADLLPLRVYQMILISNLSLKPIRVTVESQINCST